MTWKNILLMIWPACIVAIILILLGGEPLIQWLADNPEVTLDWGKRLQFGWAVLMVGLFASGGGLIVVRLKNRKE